MQSTVLRLRAHSLDVGSQISKSIYQRLGPRLSQSILLALTLRLCTTPRMIPHKLHIMLRYMCRRTHLEPSRSLSPDAQTTKHSYNTFSNRRPGEGAPAVCVRYAEAVVPGVTSVGEGVVEVFLLDFVGATANQ